MIKKGPYGGMSYFISVSAPCNGRPGRRREPCDYRLSYFILQYFQVYVFNLHSPFFLIAFHISFLLYSFYTLYLTFTHSTIHLTVYTR